MSHAEFRRISRWVFKYCCGVEFPSVLRKFAPLFLLPPRYTQVYQWRIQGSSRGGPGPTPYFWTKNFLIDRPPLLSKGLDDRPPPPYLKVRIRHCILGYRRHTAGVTIAHAPLYLPLHLSIYANQPLS